MEKDQTSSSLTSQSTLCSTLYVPVAQRQKPHLAMDQLYPFNPAYVNLTSEILKIISEHFHENPSYTDAEGHKLARDHLAQFFGVKRADVCLTPTIAQAQWYLLNLFLDNGDTVACNLSLVADLAKVKTDTYYRIRDLSKMETAKLIMVRYPDIDSEATLKTVIDFANNIGELEKSFEAPKAFAVEEPFALLDADSFGFSVRNSKLPERTPVYLITSLTQPLLNDASGFSVIVLLNNKEGRFGKLTKALGCLAGFYNPPNTALHPLVSKIMPAIDMNLVLKNFSELEKRKAEIAQRLFEKKIETVVPPANVFLIGIRKTKKLTDLIQRGELRIPPAEKFRLDHPFIYLSVLYPDSLFDRLAEIL